MESENQMKFINFAVKRMKKVSSQNSNPEEVDGSGEDASRRWLND